jgi:glycosyltransferase involved in cell wall biosynthesis
VDDTCRDRLIYEHAIPDERVRVILNFVDLRRFDARARLPERPKRALVFSNNMTERTGLGAIREACARSGIELDAIGIGVGRGEARPEEFLGRYDLVFAKARCALEALAVGTAVVLCDAAGVGGMVTTGNLDRLRRLNFGVRTLQERTSADVIEREIARYDAEDAAEVSRRIRDQAGLEAAVDQIVALYQEVLGEHGGGSAADAVGEGRAAAAYLRRVTSHLRNERQSLVEDNEKLHHELVNSTTARLRDWVVRVPILSTPARFLARKALRPRSG